MPRTVVVTGGETGIGRAVATTFVQEGARVVITGRRVESRKDAATTLGVSGEHIRRRHGRSAYGDRVRLHCWLSRIEPQWPRPPSRVVRGAPWTSLEPSRFWLRPPPGTSPFRCLRSMGARGQVARPWRCQRRPSTRGPRQRRLTARRPGPNGHPGPRRPGQGVHPQRHGKPHPYRPGSGDVRAARDGNRRCRSYGLRPRVWLWAPLAGSPPPQSLP